jgi:hypothetical protein
MYTPPLRRLLFAVAVTVTGHPFVDDGQSTLAQNRFRLEIVQAGKALNYAMPTAVVCNGIGIRVESARYGRGLPDSTWRNGRVVARLFASAAITQRGYAKGWNFIYVDSTANGWRQLVVPEDPNVPLSARAIRMLNDTARAHPLKSPVIICSGIRGAEMWYPCNGGKRCCCDSFDPECIEPFQRLAMLWDSPPYAFPGGGLGPRPVPDTGLNRRRTTTDTVR